MNLNYLQIIARYNSKILLRSWLFRLFFLFAFCCIVFLQLKEQSNLFRDREVGLFSLGCYIPYLNAYLFTLFQLIPVIFLVNLFSGQDRRLDTMDAIYYRPATNAEFVWGTCLGVIRVFFGASVVSLFFACLINIFASLAPFNVGEYLFYLFTFILPSLVFTLGFSYFIAVWVRHHALVLLILAGYFIFMLSYAGDFQQGLFDSLGVTLPNAISEISGHSNLAAYLLQRACWFFLGLGFMQLSVLVYRRIPERAGKSVRQFGMLVIFTCLGLGCGVTLFHWQQREIADRKTYVATYDKYADVPKATLFQQDITYQQLGDRVKVNSSLVLNNQTSGDLEEVILYLNPSLQVIQITTEGRKLDFHRDHQVIRVDESLKVGASLKLDIVYEGGIDENICYLDVPDERLNDTQFRVTTNCRYGKRYTFLSDDFTLLIPEVLWYPVALPPVNPKMSYDIPKDFTRYTLRVVEPGRKTVISQGKKSYTETTTIFRNEKPLCGVSLCMGDYKTHVYTLDSVRYELNVFRKHTHLFPELSTFTDGMIVDMISGAKKKIENSMGSSYPYQRLVLTESPITLTSYFRNERGGSEFIQPEQAFFTERGQGVWKRTSTGRYDVEKENVITFFTGKERYKAKSSLSDHFLNLFRKTSIQGMFRSEGFSALSLHRGVPLFHNYQMSVRSEAYPVLDAIFNHILLGGGSDRSMPMDESRQDAFDYLAGHSLEEAVKDRQLPSTVLPWILKLKVRELVNIFMVKDIKPSVLASFVKTYVSEHAFAQIEFEDFNRAFIKQFGVDWMEILPGWYSANRLPSYLVKDFVIYPILSPETGKYDTVRVEIAIYNDSDVDGIVNFQSRGIDEAGYSDSYETVWGNVCKVYDRAFVIPAKTAKRIAYCREGYMEGATLNTNISENIPAEISPYRASVMEIPDYSEYVREVDPGYFLSPPGETVVDNEDPGFQVAQSEEFKWIDYLQKKDTVKERNRTMFSILVPSTKWRTCIRPEAYGAKICSSLFRIAGDGESFVEWNTSLEKEGTYDVYAYFPGVSLGYVVMLLDTEDRTKPVEVNQTYLVSTADGEKEVVVDMYNKKNWILIGTFTCNAGQNKIVLSDKGIKNQTIHADAVKWVYQGNKE